MHSLTWSGVVKEQGEKGEKWRGSDLVPFWNTQYSNLWISSLELEAVELSFIIPFYSEVKRLLELHLAGIYGPLERSGSGVWSEINRFPILTFNQIGKNWELSWK